MTREDEYKMNDTKDKNHQNKGRIIDKQDKINPLFFYVLKGVCKCLGLFLRCKIDRSDEFVRTQKSGSTLILTNHLSVYDIIPMVNATFCRKTNFVIAQNMRYFSNFFGMCIDKYPLITKKQFVSDIKCIKSIKRWLDSGVSVVICATGKISSEGFTSDIGVSTAKLAKWLGYPVLTIVNKGTGIMRPKWAYNSRKSKIGATCDLLFSREDLKNKSVLDLKKDIDNALLQNDHIYQIENGIKVSNKRRAEGLERLLYLCPRCKAEGQNKTEKDKIICRNCNNIVKYTKWGVLEPLLNSECPSRIDLWYEIQRDLLAEEVKCSDFMLSNRVLLFVSDEQNGGYKFVAEGVLSLNHKRLKFVSLGDVRPKSVVYEQKINRIKCEAISNCSDVENIEECFKEIIVPLKGYNTIASNPGESLSFHQDNMSYNIYFIDEKKSTKYTIAVEEIFKNSVD